MVTLVIIVVSANSKPMDLLIVKLAPLAYDQAHSRCSIDIFFFQNKSFLILFLQKPTQFVIQSIKSLIFTKYKKNKNLDNKLNTFLKSVLLNQK